MLHICFAAGPLQLMCIKEFILLNPKSKFIIYLMLYKENELVNSQMFNSIDMLKLKHIKPIYFKKSKFINTFQNFLLAKVISFKYKKKIPTFLIMDFRNTFMHYLRVLFQESRFILIDDGFHTYVNYKKYMEKNIYLPYFNYSGFLGKLNKFFYYGFKYNELYNKKIDLFSIYAKELKLPNKSYNKLKSIQNLKNNKIFSYDDEKVFFCGTKLVERGVLSMDEELNIIKKLRDYWASKNKKLFYIAKRTSSKEKLNKIRDILSVDVICFDLPLELALLNYEKLPSIVCSLGSTLNKSLPMIYSGIKTFLISISEIERKKDIIEAWAYSEQFFYESSLNENIIKI